MKAIFPIIKARAFGSKTGVIVGALIILFIVFVFHALHPVGGAEARLARILADPFPQRMGAKESYVYMRTNGDILNELGEAVTTQVVRTLRGTDSRMKVWSVRILNRIPMVRIRIVSSDSRAIYLMWELDPEKPTSRAMISNLVAMLVLPDVQGRDLPGWSADHLAAIGNDAVEPLVTAIHSPDPKLRKAVGQALSLFECEGWNENAIKHSASVSSPGYHYPAQIGSANGERVFAALKDSLLDPVAGVRLAATNNLERFGHNNSLAPKLRECVASSAK